MSVWTEEDVLCSYTAYRKRKKARVLKQRLTIDRFPKRHSTPKQFWTPGMVDDLREMAARGMSYQQIADALGIKRTQVSSKMQALHLKVGKRNAQQDGNPNWAHKQ